MRLASYMIEASDNICRQEVIACGPINLSAKHQVVYSRIFIKPKQTWQNPSSHIHIWRHGVHVLFTFRSLFAHICSLWFYDARLAPSKCGRVMFRETKTLDDMDCALSCVIFPFMLCICCLHAANGIC